MNILIDTNIALYLFGGDSRLSEILEGQIVHVSFITELELMGYPGLRKKEEKLIQNFLEDCVIIDVNNMNSIPLQSAYLLLCLPKAPWEVTHQALLLHSTWKQRARSSCFIILELSDFYPSPALSIKSFTALT